jgi:hypothetical protein
MNPELNPPSRAEVLEEVSKWTVGLGMVTMVLFPLALPIIALTAVALLPLVVPVLAVGLLAAVVVLPIRLIRRAGIPIEPTRTPGSVAS